MFDAPEAHCRSGRLLVSLDGQEVARLRFVSARERSSLRKRIRVPPGTHAFELCFEGRPGGCNVGYVSSWGGEITLKGGR